MNTASVEAAHAAVAHRANTTAATWLRDERCMRLGAAPVSSATCPATGPATSTSRHAPKTHAVAAGARHAPASARPAARSAKNAPA